MLDFMFITTRGRRQLIGQRDYLSFNRKTKFSNAIHNLTAFIRDLKSSFPYTRLTWSRAIKCYHVYIATKSFEKVLATAKLKKFYRMHLA